MIKSSFPVGVLDHASIKKVRAIPAVAILTEKRASINQGVPPPPGCVSRNSNETLLLVWVSVIVPALTCPEPLNVGAVEKMRLGSKQGVGLGVGDPLAVGDAVGEGEGVREGEGDGLGVRDGDADGVGAPDVIVNEHKGPKS